MILIGYILVILQNRFDGIMTMLNLWDRRVNGQSYNQCNSSKLISSLQNLQNIGPHSRVQ